MIINTVYIMSLMRKYYIFIFQQVARNRKRDTEASEMNTKVTLAIESVNEMKRTVENVVFKKYYIIEFQYSAR